MLEVLEYVNEHYREDVRINQLAAIAGFSESHFRRVFKELTGKTLTLYLQVLRVEEACKLLKNKENSIDIFAENKAYLEKLEQERKQKHSITQEVVKIDRELKFIGQTLNTYLIFEDGQDVYIADQHAAHERIIFDKLNSALNNGNIASQPLLVPYILNVNMSEYTFLIDKIPLLNSMGIEITEFGRNSFKVSAIPTFLTDINLKNFFNDVLMDIDGLKSISVNELLLDKLAQKACKAAIKSGDRLSDIEIETLMQALKDNLGLKCPHGRPVAIKITRTEIDKWFKRIV